MGCATSIADGGDGTSPEMKTPYDELPNVKIIHGQKIDKYFNLDKVLGSGGSCRVLKGKRKSDKTLCAVKELIKDDQWNPMLFEKEIQILSALNGHPNILEYQEAYISSKYFYLCTKLCTGGELFDKVKKLKHFSEAQAAEVIKIIISAIGHCHDKHIVHRDLKPENIVYETRKTDSSIVIIDFGDAEVVAGENHLYSDFVGTPFYLAPECVRHRCGWELYKSDMWAIGVITYVLLTGRPPFWGRNNREILSKIIKADVHWPSGVDLSNSCKKFIGDLLNKDPRKRMSAQEALTHEWLKHESKTHTSHFNEKYFKHLKKFQSSCKLKKLIVSAMVKEMSDQEFKFIARAFKELDLNGDGVLEHHELAKYLTSTGLREKQANMRASELINAMDKDKDGKIDLDEWVHGKAAEQLTKDTKAIEKQFERILSSSPDETIDETREITAGEIMKSFGDLVNENELEEIIKEIDQDGNGTVSFKEFKFAMQNYTMTGAADL